MKIISANKKDIKEITKLFKIPEFKLAYGRYMDETFYKIYLNKNYFLVAEEGKEIIGAMMGEEIKGKGVIMWYLATKKQYRKKGVATSLLKEFERRCKKKGIRWIMGHSIIKKDLIKFYEKNRYKRGVNCIEYAKELK